MTWIVGQTLASVAKPPITREQLSEYAQASGDINPIHLDESVAKVAGFSSVIAHGMISMAVLADCVRCNFPEELYRVDRFRSRFRKVAFPGDQLTCDGKVKSVSSEGMIVVSLSAKNQNGDVVTDGEADIFPTR